MNEMYCYHVGIFMYVYYRMSNKSITSLFSHASNVHSHNTRSRVDSSLLQKQ